MPLVYAKDGGILLPLPPMSSPCFHPRVAGSFHMGLNFFERLTLKTALAHLLSHWPAHLVWVFPAVAFLVPSLKSYEGSHPGALISQIIGICLSVAARYISPYVGVSS
jgi:hypothetical protein